MNRSILIALCTLPLMLVACQRDEGNEPTPPEPATNPAPAPAPEANPAPPASPPEAAPGPDASKEPMPGEQK